MSGPENPRAFPSNAIDPAFGGATLLDLFAAHALGGLVVNPAGASLDDIASDAYAYARAMLAERAVQQ